MPINALGVINIVVRLTQSAARELNATPFHKTSIRWALTSREATVQQAEPPPCYQSLATTDVLRGYLGSHPPATALSYLTRIFFPLLLSLAFECVLAVQVPKSSSFLFSPVFNFLFTPVSGSAPTPIHHLRPHPRSLSRCQPTTKRRELALIHIDCR